MTQEDKQFLLVDLCARLPYHVKIHTWYVEVITSDLNTFPFSIDEMDEEGMWDQLNDFKPYLRPMSSMTEDEEREFEETLQYTQFTLESYDWLLVRHFDFRGLILKHLAIEAPEGMYKTKQIMIEYARYYDELLQNWVNVIILQFDGNYAIVRNGSGRYLRILITKLQY